jgi:hypothetical protein
VLPLLKYTVFRLALFVTALVLLSLVGAGQVIAVVGAAAVSFLLSYLLLRRPREELAEKIAERVERRHFRGRTAAEQDADLEDAAVEDAAHEDAAPQDAAPRDAAPEDAPTADADDAPAAGKKSSRER